MRLTPALLVLSLLACSRPAAVASAPPRGAAPEAADEPAGSEAPSEPGAAPSDPRCERAWTEDDLAASATAPFKDILVQLDAGGNALVNLHTTVSTPFSRVPELTLLRDGTIVRATESGVVSAKLTPAETSAFVDRLAKLGAGRLVSHVGNCTCPGPGAGGVVCLEDADTTILRIVVDGTLRHAIVYGDFWNDAAAAHAILDEIRKQRPRRETPYVPKAATLVFVARPDDAGPTKCTPVPPALGAVFERPEHGYFIWARAVEGKELAGLARVLSSGHDAVCVGKQIFLATLYPWLPGMDHHGAIKSWQDRAATIGSE